MFKSINISGMTVKELIATLEQNCKPDQIVLSAGSPEAILNLTDDSVSFDDRSYYLNDNEIEEIRNVVNKDIDRNWFHPKHAMQYIKDNYPGWKLLIRSCNTIFEYNDGDSIDDVQIALIDTDTAHIVVGLMDTDINALYPFIYNGSSNSFDFLR